MTRLIDPGRGARWGLLAEWAAPGGEVPRAARDLLGGIEPQDPANRRELLILALLAVSTNRAWLREEFAARRFLGPEVDVAALVDWQMDLTGNILGSAAPLTTLGMLLRDSLPVELRARVYSCAGAAPRGKDREVIWVAAVRFGHLAQTIAEALALGERLRWYRYLSAGDVSSSCALAPNAVACVNEPWAAGTRRIVSRAKAGSTVVELDVPAAGLVAVAHIEPSQAQDKHPARFAGESGHPVVAAYPPLAVFAPSFYTGPRELARWKRVHPAEVCNHLDSAVPAQRRRRNWRGWRR